MSFPFVPSLPCKHSCALLSQFQSVPLILSYPIHSFPWKDGGPEGNVKVYDKEEKHIPDGMLNGQTTVPARLPDGPKKTGVLEKGMRSMAARQSGRVGWPKSSEQSKETARRRVGAWRRRKRNKGRRAKGRIRVLAITIDHAWDVIITDGLWEKSNKTVKSTELHRRSAACFIWLLLGPPGSTTQTCSRITRTHECAIKCFI